MLETEPLFLLSDSFLDTIDNKFEKLTSKIENWYDAKELAVKIFRCKYPEKMFNTYINALDVEFHFTCTAYKEKKHSEYTKHFSVSPEDRHKEVQGVAYSLALITHYMYLLTKDEKYNRLKTQLGEFLKWYVLNPIFDQITEAFNNGEIEDSYDYLLNAPKSKEEEQKSVPSDDETTTIVTGKKGQENKRRITARQIGQIVDEYKWESGLKKDQFLSMLHRITGLSEASLKDAIRCKEK